MRQICNEMHDFYRKANVKDLQRLCFRASSFPKLAMSSKAAYEALVANDVDYVPLEDAKDRIAATLALIYPPGIGVVVPGERWDDNAKPMRDYFLAFEVSLSIASRALITKCKASSKSGWMGASSSIHTSSVNERGLMNDGEGYGN